MTDRLTTRNAQAAGWPGASLQAPGRKKPEPVGSLRSTTATQPPAFPVTHPQAPTQPLIEPVEQFQLRGQTEVTHPPAEIAPQFAHPPVYCYSPAAAGESFDPVFEVPDVLLRHVDRRATTSEHEAQPFLQKKKGQPVRFHHADLLLIHHQAKFHREVTAHGVVQPLRTPRRLRENHKVIRIAHKAQTSLFQFPVEII